MDQLRLCLVTDRHQTRGRDLVTLVGDCVAAGLPSVQVREKDLGAGALAALCRQLLCVTLHSLFIVNDRVDVALATGAGGVQRTSTSLAVRDIRQVVGRSLYVGASVHSLEEAIEAETEGADWLIFGPVYDTPSKRAYGSPQGLPALARIAKTVTIPVIAIGGLTPERVAEVREAGAQGVAVISAVLSAPSPGDAVCRFLDALDHARS